ncbi:MAG: prolyl oligopeptidase family serine peptidase [Marinagarivorans sp.]|nr:prolyl oligopeptidase family serine peptidase [Marinagarivorans sp.]
MGGGYWNGIIAKQAPSADFFDAISPVNFAKEFKAPVLLIHAKDDTVVNIDQSEKMHSKLNGAKKVVEFKKIKGDNMICIRAIPHRSLNRHAGICGQTYWRERSKKIEP